MSSQTRCVPVFPSNLSAVNFLRYSLLFMLFALASCSPRYGIAERGSHVATAHVDKTASTTRDTVLIKEKVRFVKINDTIYRDSVLVLTKNRTRIDTIFRVDSILMSDTINMTTFRDPRSSFQKAAEEAGNVCLFLIVIVIIVQLLKLKRHD